MLNYDDVRMPFQFKSFSREERREIVAKYDRGREDGAVIDDWEDPKFDIYHKKDRYGFIHDHRLPEIVSRYNQKQSRGLEINRINNVTDRLGSRRLLTRRWAEWTSGW